jgi:hypothetical protein
MSKLRLVPAAGGTPIEIDGSKVVGRDATADVVVDDASVSRKHARIEQRGEAWTIADQASANGTFLNGQRVTEAGLRNGQTVRFGDVSYTVEIEGGDEDLAATRLGVARPTLPPPPPAAAPRAASASPATPGQPPATAQRRQGKSPMIWIGGCCGCLLLLAILTGILRAIAIPSFSRSTDQPSEAPSDPGSTPETPASGQLKLESSRATKTRDGDTTKVEVTLTVTGYGTRPSGSSYEFDLQEDLQTLNPEGQPMPDLSKENIERRQSLTSSAEGEPQQFTSTLTIDSNPPAGKYLIRMTITDHISGATGVKMAQFSLP